MSLRTFTMTDEQVDALIIEELQDALQRNMVLERDEGGFPLDPDRRLIESLLVVLAYYMPHYDYEAYRKQIALERLSIEDQLLESYTS